MHFSYNLLKMDNIDTEWQLEGIWGSSFLYTAVTLADFRDSGNKPCREDKFIR